MSKAVTFSDRELEVARLLAGGMTQKQVASALRISRRTVDHYVARLRQKTGSATTAAAVSRARARGLGPRTSA